jgi:outer membrane protein TolC
MQATTTSSRLRAGATALAIGLIVALSAAAPGLPAAAGPRVVAAGPTAAPVQPTPYPLITLGPANAPTTMPFPAYGSPVPGVGTGPAPQPGVPQIINLTQAVEVGFALNPNLASARADVGIALAEKRLQQTGYYPNLSIVGTTGHTNRQASSITQTTGTGTGTGSGSSTFTVTGSGTSNSLTVELRQLIFDGGKIGAAITSASYNEAASIDTYKRELQTISYNVAQAYYTALLAKRTTAVAVETVKLDLVQEDLVRAQIRAGTEAAVDLSTAQLPTAQARVALVKAQAAELNALAAFANALGLDANVDIQPFDDTPVTATGSISTIPVPSYDKALARAYALRPDYAAAQRTVDSYAASLRSARLGLFPTLSGGASAGPASSSTNGGDYRNSNTLDLTLTIPLFDQGITAANSLQARYELDNVRAQLEIQRQALQLNVKQTLVSLVGARAQLDAAQAEYRQANDVLRSTQAQYKAGVTTLPLLLNAQVGIVQALSDQVSAVYSLRQAEQAYLYATGANTP